MNTIKRFFTTLLTPAAIKASQQGPVRPWWEQGSSVTQADAEMVSTKALSWQPGKGATAWACGAAGASVAASSSAAQAAARMRGMSVSSLARAGPRVGRRL